MKTRMLLGCLAFLASASAVLADAIDGQWCLGASHFEINGQNIRMQGGNNITGNYHRHGFEYVVPPKEEGAGTQIVMVLLNEETVHLTRGTSAPEDVEAVQADKLRSDGEERNYL